MKHGRVYAAALILGSIGTLLTMAFHPTAHDLLTTADQVARRNEIITMATHSLALASYPLLFFGLLGLSRRLCLDRPLVLGALTAFGFGGTGVLIAAVASGLVAPRLSRQILESSDPGQEALHALFFYNGLLNQGFAKVFVVASSLALILWSLAMYKMGGLARVASGVGLVCASLSLAAFTGGHLRLDVHGFGLFVLAQAVWYVLVGIVLWRDRWSQME